MATKGECCCSDGPVGIVRGLGEAGVPLEKAVHLCELYYAVQYRDGAGKVPRRLDLIGLHEQAFGNQIEAGRVLGSCGSGSGKDVGGGEGSASLDGSRGGVGERGWNGGGSLVSPSESGSRGRDVVYFGGARGPNYLRNQKDRMRKAMAKRERIEREAENRGRIAALKVVAQKGELTEDEKLLKHLKVKRMLAAEEKRLSETGSPSLVFDSALRQLMKAGDLADGGADEKVKKWVQKLMSAGSPEWLQADKVDGFSDADSGDSSGGGVPSGRSDVKKGDGKRRKEGKARTSSSKESTPPETVVDMSNLAPNVTSVEMSGGGIRIVHHGKFVRFVDSSGTSTNSAGVPYNKVSAMDYIKKHSYMQAVNYPNMGFSDYVRHNKMNYNTACMYNYLIDEFKLDVVKLGHAVGKIEKTKK